MASGSQASGAAQPTKPPRDHQQLTHRKGRCPKKGGKTGGNKKEFGGPNTLAKLKIVIEIMENVEALKQQILRDFPSAADADKITKRFEQEKQNGLYPAGVTYVRKDGTVVVKFLAHTVFQGEDDDIGLADLRGTILHELSHAELKGYEQTGKDIDPPTDATGHGGKFVEVVVKLSELFAKWKRTQKEKMTDKRKKARKEKKGITEKKKSKDM